MGIKKIIPQRLESQLAQRNTCDCWRLLISVQDITARGSLGNVQSPTIFSCFNHDLPLEVEVGIFANECTMQHSFPLNGTPVPPPNIVKLKSSYFRLFHASFTLQNFLPTLHSSAVILKPPHISSFTLFFLYLSLQHY